jgi:hypothetical protein
VVSSPATCCNCVFVNGRRDRSGTLEGGEVPTRSCGTALEVRRRELADVPRCREHVVEHSVGDLADELAHPGLHGGEDDRDPRALLPKWPAVVLDPE